LKAILNNQEYNVLEMTDTHVTLELGINTKGTYPREMVKIVQKPAVKIYVPFLKRKKK
jgi:hypothetical protein